MLEKIRLRSGSPVACKARHERSFGDPRRRAMDRRLTALRSGDRLLFALRIFIDERPRRIGGNGRLRWKRRNGRCGWLIVGGQRRGLIVIGRHRGIGFGWEGRSVVWRHRRCRRVRSLFDLRGRIRSRGEAREWRRIEWGSGRVGHRRRARVLCDANDELVTAHEDLSERRRLQGRPDVQLLRARHDLRRCYVIGVPVLAVRPDDPSTGLPAARLREPGADRGQSALHARELRGPFGRRGPMRRHG